MLRFWLKSALFSLCVASLFAGVASLGPDDASTARGKGLAAFGSLLHALLVEPLGMPLAFLTVFAITLAVCGFFALGRGPSAIVLGEDDDREKNASSSPSRRVEMAAKPEPVGGSPSRTFGQKGISKRRFGPDGTEYPPKDDPAELVLFAVREDGLDWYFAHYGFEGNWKKARVGLVAMGRRDLADILERAGDYYDWFDREHQRGSVDGPSDDATRAYIEQMHVHNRAWKIATGRAP